MSQFIFTKPFNIPLYFREKKEGKKEAREGKKKKTKKERSHQNSVLSENICVPVFI
jgi:hypothetical protein